MLGLVIGNTDLVTGFRLVGVEGVEVRSVQEAEKALAQALSRRDLAMIIVSEEFSSQMRSQIDSARSEQIAPLIVEVPGAEGSGAESRMSDLISKTLGMKL
ncbi:MAG: V-type ATP synthase subunit F [Candidatus Bathyarchaeota archaeon]|nr:V-type ATP synthase subunit F [Candidatus Bathyarchaeota archaeon]